MGWGAQKFGMSFESQGSHTFLAGYPGILPGYPRGAPKSFRKEVCVQFVAPKEGGCFEFPPFAMPPAHLFPPRVRTCLACRLANERRPSLNGLAGVYRKGDLVDFWSNSHKDRQPCSRCKKAIVIEILLTPDFPDLGDVLNLKGPKLP